MEHCSIFFGSFSALQKQVKVAWVSEVSGDGGVYNSLCTLNKTDIE